MMKRPNMRDYFRAQIDRHVNGGLSGSVPRLPQNVKTIKGSVTDSRIVVTMLDGTEYVWSGGRYGSRKVNLCYPPLMPLPFTVSKSPE